MSQPVFECAHALHCYAIHGPHTEDLKGDSTRVQKKARHKKLQQRLGDSPTVVLPLASSIYGRICVW